MRQIEAIAKIYTDFPCKFGIPRQSGLSDTVARVEFEKKFRSPEALRGIEEYSHLWLIWDFSEAHSDKFSPTVRPPRLGGNVRKGVFATRSPFRPNSMGLSCVKLLGVDYDCENAPVLIVSGADILSGTEIYDIKPYIPYADCIPDAAGSFADEHAADCVEVIFDCEVPSEIKNRLESVLSLDPRPSYKNDEEREYAFEFGGFRIKFTGENGKITVTSVVPL